jgi:hypothetical protein
MIEFDFTETKQRREVHGSVLRQKKAARCNRGEKRREG